MAGKISIFKSDLRKAAKSKRSRIYSVKSEKDAQNLLADYLLRKVNLHQIIASYSPIQSEISPKGAIEGLAERGYPLCLPVVIERSQPLKFRSWRINDEMIVGDYGVSIPSGGDWVVPEVIIVPLLAFDEKGYRLGYGGGFYDRTLEKLKREKEVMAVGFAFSGQYCADIPRDEYDYRLDTIVTEQGITEFGRPQ
ncbi:MAG: 5-formyltetrahydrofolate cyclo-ligase [Rhodobacteraceae bacterium]|nr:5-formyltetrahydrofolate cyclo-ligase [Paracoccaceae bacterium]